MKVIKYKFMLLGAAFIVLPLIAMAQELNISGTILDSNGDPIAGASVVVKGTTNGITTGINGDYNISAPPDATLTFSFLGMATKEEAVGGRARIDIQMQQGDQSIEEVVVVAYGTQRKRDLTGAVSVVDVGEIKKLQSSNIGQALQSLAAGVSVTTSGAPGSGSDIRIRGIGSFSNAGPLYVVDGMILDGSQREFNVNDIESIQVLKDASATALYGSRGAGGVILITTKKGSGQTKIDVTATYGLQQIANRIEMMNSIDFLRINRAAYENANRDWPGEPAQGAILVNTDWQDEFFQTAKTQDYNISVSGGSDKGKYLFSLGYYNQDGVVKGPTHDRITVRSNVEATKGWFTFGENLLVAHSTTVPLYGSPFIDLARMPPVIPVRNADGSYGTGSSSYQTYGSNPIALQEIHQERQTSKRAIGNAYMQISPIKNLQIKTNAGVEYHNWFDRYLTLNKQVRYLSATLQNHDNYLFERKGNFLTWIWENTAFYQQEIGAHKFDVLLGYTLQERTEHNNEAEVYDMPEGFYVLGAGVTEPSVSGADNAYAMSSVLGRINYSYGGRYLLQMNVRRDGSSRFGRNYRYGVFPSGSVGWRISEEQFFTPAKNYIDDLKLRASYGVIGDQQALPNYAYSTYITRGTDGAIFGPEQTYYPGAIQKGRANPNLRWEQKTTLNTGIDFALLNQKLYGAVEWFNSDSKDLLLQIPVSWTSGTDITPWTNYGEIRNRGVEITLGFRETQKELKYNLAFNFTSVSVEVLQLGESYREAGISGVNRSEKGRSVGDFYVIATDGIFQNVDEVYAHTSINPETGAPQLIQPNAAPGDIRYKDLNGDGKIDKGDRYWAGSPFPKFEAGLTFSVEYRGFDLNLFLAGVYGNKIYNNVKYWLERMDETSNLPAGLSPWSATNPSSTTPRPYYGPNDNTIPYSDRWIEDGSYLRLKNLQIGYSLQPAALKSLGFAGGARVWAGAQNLFTITSYSGFDPEISGGSIFGKGNDDGHFPPVRTFLMGLQLTF